MAETKLQWHTEKRKVGDLIPWDKNPRKLSDAQKKQLETSLAKFDLVEIPAINTDNKLIAGHQRTALMILAGRTEEMIDVRVPNRKLTKEEFEEYNLRSNRNVGDWDWGLLDELDRTLLLEVGFEEGEIISQLGLENAGDETVEEERLEALQVFPPEAPKLKERLAIHFKTWDEYQAVKKAVEAGKITAEKIIALV